jgi:murein DD-endopeptidase MepM/ murein hydrolase activator NlpD
MAKVKYYYDSENLAYRKIITKKRKKFMFALLFIVASALFGFLAFVVLLNTPYFETPKNKLQAREIENLKLNYAILNKKMDQLEEGLSAVEDRDDNIYRVYFNAEPISKEGRKSGNAYVNRYKELEGYDNSQLVLNTTKRVDGLRRELAIQSKSLDYILKLAKEKSSLLAAIPAIQPVSNENLKRMASGFGYRTDPFTKARKMHQGMDFTANTGTPIYATGDGIVAQADNTASGYGNHVVINHGFGYETLYAHMSRPHCHYEVHSNGNVVNPLNFYYGNISAVEYVAISQIANQENQSLD